MKIGFTGLDLPAGKHKYNDETFNALVEKCKPKKVSPFYAEFAKGDWDSCDVLVAAKTSALDLLIADIEKLESRRDRSEGADKGLAEKALGMLESETPLSDGGFSPAERESLGSVGLLSLKPVLLLDAPLPANETVTKCLEKAAVVFFYTCGPDDVRAWPVPAGSDIVTCAGKIHTDLARGFIKADIVTVADFLAAHNMNDARKRGTVKLVDRDYIIQPGDIIEIRFSV